MQIHQIKGINRLIGFSNSILDRGMLTEHLFIVIIAAIIGTGTGFTTVIVHKLLHGTSKLVYGNGGSFLQNLQSIGWEMKSFIATIALMLILPLLNLLKNKKYYRLLRYLSIAATASFCVFFYFCDTSGESGHETFSFLNSVKESPWYVLLSVPALGGLLVGPLIYYHAREAKGHGVPEVMQSIILRGGVIRPIVAFIKSVTAIITIGTGGSVGREGPVIQIGATIGSTIGQKLHVSGLRMKTFVGCGAAAGIAAAFNAPIAGAFFAMEVLLQDFTFSMLSPIIISSVISTVISHAYIGNFASFIVPKYEFVNHEELILYVLLAVVTALVGFLFLKLLYFFEDFFDETIKINSQFMPFFGGILIGTIGLFYPEIMGTGYETISSALNGDTIWTTAFILIFIKVLATSLTLGSGGSGGVFAPALFLGAMTGAFFGGVANSILPGSVSNAGAYALVAMGGLVAATTQAPITAIIIVFELTNDYQIILPLMITCILSTIIFKSLSRESIYTLKLVKRNIVIKNGAEINIMKSLYAKDIYTTTFESIGANWNFDRLVTTVLSGKAPYFPVVDSRKAVIGIISIHDIKENLYDKHILKDILIAKDIASTDLMKVTLEMNCHQIMSLMSSKNLEGLPVVKKDTDKIIGMIWRKDIIDAYNKEIERRDIASSFSSQITMKNIDSSVHFMEGVSMTEIAIPKTFIGKSIKELNIRAKYGVEIILIRHNTKHGSKIKAIPDANYTFSFTDSIVIAGEIGKINSIKAL